jgi:dolichol-phosphate mannosyltransferase
MKLLVIIPTYNESENIGRLLDELMQIPALLEVLVVDDNSPDQTARIVKSFIQKNPKVHLLERPGKMGLGSAYITGLQWGLKRGFEAFLEMDADFSHEPSRIPHFLEALKTHDVVIGSRWIPGGSVVNWPLRRVLLSRLGNLYSQAILGMGVRDLTGGYIGYRRCVLEAIGLHRIHSDGYSFQIEMKYRALKKGFRLTEIPIRFADRTAGASKISRRIVLEALLIVWILRFSLK